MVREIELSKELWRTRFLDKNYVTWMISDDCLVCKYVLVNLSVTKVLNVFRVRKMFDQDSQKSNFQLESLILAQNERWRQA